ncbi:MULTISPECIES: adenylate kinase [Fructobacillus]|uniref:Adenylate kinase n=2 Tax=Fructobacillus TaxID=559173 RepID=A0A3F3H3X8_9LACO|nr:adenylate kinase [Fructobacillus tropaeoli]CAK1226318.1 Adenylate kinase or related kinase (Adk) [Fructobacillus sp. LMG 32999]NLS38578.1 adenylate kinase [Fructobacillus tropaeoli]CAK1239495.1 Adenylate kinase or related kinase (Adk) [Fructobacillus sp. LMG 32999]CAK1242615.1 Adenylate kinase or related kinase (Adk) [Fructobacillus tropaeoli]CAK1244481.1 Adenylate kinase or related kinase (Adk) [Fructobacillus sp. LMG 32999]
MTKNLILLGLPGAGKGTQAEKIIADYPMVHISTGDIFRANMKEETELGQKAKAFMDAGNLVPDEITNAMVADRLSQPDVVENGFMLDGYPRNEEQAKFLDQFLAEKNDKVSATLYFEVPDQVLVDRLMNRGRADDTKDVIAHRLEVNKKANLPLVDYYENHGVLHTIDGNGELDRIYADVKSVLDALD